MKIWKDLHANLRTWWSTALPRQQTTDDNVDRPHLDVARESLQELLNDQRVPANVRGALTEDYRQIETMLDKLEHEQIHIVVFGRVSVGKSALVNTLLGEERFSTSPLHGETRDIQTGQWQEYRDGNVLLIDTPGINEIRGDDRERLADEVAQRADLVLFVVEGDITHPEYTALRRLGRAGRPILLVLNKADRYSQAEREQLRDALLARTGELIAGENLVLAAARPAARWVVYTDEDGSEREERRDSEPDVAELRDRLWQIMEQEGRTLAALNASLFAGMLSDQVGTRILAARRTVGERIIRTWCVGKGVAVALNPVPVADLIAAAAVDVSMVVHLSRVYGLPLTRHEAGDLVKTIGAQMLVLMGTIWTVHLASSALKLGTSGLSAVFTGGAQGAVAYYSTYIVGQAAERYLVNGKSWGDAGPKLAVREILDSLEKLDGETVLAQAKTEIAQRLKSQNRRQPA